MPYKSAKNYREQHAGWYAARYANDAKFRRAEAKRKADWYAARASDPAWLAEQAAKKRAQRAKTKKKIAPISRNAREARK